LPPGERPGIPGPIVASNVDANLTFNRLLETKLLPPEFSEAINRIRL